MKAKEILDPLGEYNEKFSKSIIKNSNDYFEDLVKKSGIDVEKNKRLVAEYDELLKQYKEASSKGNNTDLLKKMCLFGGIALIVLGIILCFFCGGTSGGALAGLIVFIVLFFLLGLGGLLGYFLYFKKMSELLNRKTEELKNKKDNKLQECYESIDALNSLYDYDMPQEIFNKTIDIINFDNNFDLQKYLYVKDKYNYQKSDNVDESLLYVMSGDIQGNPFLVERYFEKEMVNVPYSGELVVKWITYDSDNRAHNHKEKLTATIYKPAPNYYGVTQLRYFNDAGNQLSFSRKPVVDKNWSEKDIESYVKKYTKQAQKIAKKELKEGLANSYTHMNNDTFEALFGAINRDNEHEFRLLFTPLAQNNIVKLVKDKKVFGDDFSFDKSKGINTIISEHSQKINYDLCPNDFKTYSYQIAKENFVNLISKAFDSIYFDFAPLLSIPLYQQLKNKDFVNREFPSNYNPMLHECLANAMDPSYFIHKEATTSQILKTRFVSKDNLADRLEVDSYSFKGVERVEYVTKLCSDGNYYDVPVHWIEYLPLVNKKAIEVKNIGHTYPDFCSLVSNNKDFDEIIGDRNYFIYRGFLLFPLDNYSYDENLDNKLTEFFKNSNLNSNINTNINKSN